MALADVAAERAVLAGVAKYGNQVYLDICDMVKVNTFTVSSNQMIFKCLDHILKKDDEAVVDLPSILSAAKDLGLNHIIERKEEAQHLNSILSLYVDQSNVRKFARKIRTLEVSRLIYEQGGVLQTKMGEVTGNESISSILGTAEDIIFDFTSLLDPEDSYPVELGSGIKEYLDYLAANPIEQAGFSTPFKEWDNAVGGGLRKGTVNVFVARMKVGKTAMADNIGYNVSKAYDMPVLNVDTEMPLRDHKHRTLAMISGVGINKIETGKFGFYQDLKNKVYGAGELLEKTKYAFKSVIGMAFEDQIAMMRRWLQRTVGLNPDGTAKDCVIIYDWLRASESNSISDALREYQILGFMMITLHNFAARYQVPIVLFIQQNRSGLEKEDTGSVYGSDRIGMFCDNLSILKDKSDEEIAEDGPEAGNKKLVVLLSRHGPGLDRHDYVNLHAKLWCAQIKEGKLRSKLSVGKIDKDDITINSSDAENIPFD